MNRSGIRKYGFIIFYIVLISALYATIGGNKEESIIRNDTSHASISSQQESEYDIFIDLNESMLYLFKEDELIKKYVVAQGKDKSPSPIGVWEIISKARNWGTGFGTRWMGINVPWGTYGIHGTNRPHSVDEGHRQAALGCTMLMWKSSTI